MNNIIILSLSLIPCLLLLFVLDKYLTRKNGDILKIHEKAIYNGKNTNPPLSVINTIGFNLYGNFRTDINGSSVKYLFFCIFFPLFPIGCYRATEGESKYLGKQGIGRVTQTKYKIYETEKWNFAEVLIIYLIVISIVIVCLIVYYSWDYLF